jgi:shikimate dehydrogenase
MHEAGYRALGLTYTYVPFEVRDLAGAITGIRALGIRGMGVSQPFKQDVMPLLDEIDPVAERIGAVNTIVNDGDRLRGHNTDWVGAVRALEEVRSLAGARVLLIGAGGAARAIAFGLRERGARTTIANRDEGKAMKLAAEVGAQGAPLSEALRAGAYDVVVNATSRGQSDSPKESTTEHAAGSDGTLAVPEPSIRADQVVMDIVYKPLRTALIDAAARRGAVVVHGGRMLLHQASAQFELYTRRSAPMAVMAEALERALLSA